MGKKVVRTAEFMDNNVEWVCGTDQVTGSFYMKRFVTKMKKLAQAYPDEVTCEENEDGSVVCHFPLKYIKISRPPKRELTEEQKKAASERFAKYRERRSKGEI